MTVNTAQSQMVFELKAYHIDQQIFYRYSEEHNWMDTETSKLDLEWIETTTKAIKIF
jgi:hypothetical protein